MIIQKETQDVIIKIASEKNLPIKTVSDIIMSQFEYTVGEIRKGEDAKPFTYKNILLKYLGTWSYNFRKAYNITKKVGRDLSDFESVDKWKPDNYEKLNRGISKE